MKPWETEPDHVDFKHVGFPCILHRNPFGAWCGYVGVPPGHPAYGRGYDDVDVEVHGGLTYADACQGGICHIPDPGEPDNVWWLGFDCSHCDDLLPYPWCKEHEAKRLASGFGQSLWHKSPHVTYRDLAYVKAQTENLAEQLSRLAAAGQVC